MSEWRFGSAERDDATAFFHEHGFVGFTDLVTPEELAALRRAYDELVADGTLDVSQGLIVQNGAMLMHPEFDRLVRRPDIVAFVEGLVEGRPIEVQHTKLNCKPLNDSGEGKIAWHQDYPFYPHTNYDLVAVGIHLDDEGPDEGPVRVVPGTHRAGPMSHVHPDGAFAYEMTEPLPEGADEGVLMTGPAGQVTVHHCLTLHTSEPKRSANLRRILITQYRARDAAQLAGVMWDDWGTPVGDGDGPRTARFPDGTVIELRGKGGRLFDNYGKLAPNR
ncbi:MAG TPA: phytanoyl-CoA dioxygenase family protein [Solirubrobacteraceae bacterium]|nr:phytanoyl-CoA dioxygenase family protein [Solirubrobacteraceae bacterium]